jgi:platelet-activating factor acetylhydrolase IB subunit alpha
LSLRHTVTKTTDTVLCLSVYPERNLLIVGSQDSTIHVWDTLYFSNLAVLQGHTRSVLNLAVYKVVVENGAKKAILLSCGRDNVIRAWDMDSWQCIGMATNVASCMFSMVLVKDYIYGGLMDTKLAVIHIPSMLKEIQSADSKIISFRESQSIKYVTGHHGYIFSICSSINGKFIYTGSGDYNARVWSIQGDFAGNPQCVAQLDENDDSITAIAEIDYEVDGDGGSRESYFLVTGTKDG